MERTIVGWSVFILCTFLSFTAFGQALNRENVLLSLPSDETVIIQVGFTVIDITSINEREENVEFEGLIKMSWKDERLKYEVDSSVKKSKDRFLTETPLLVYQGDFQVKELFEGWRPHFIIANAVGGRETRNMNLRVWPDGTVVYSEEFGCIAETPMNLRMYPFDKQRLSVYIYPHTYSTQELKLVKTDKFIAGWNKNLGIAEWDRDNIEISTGTFELETPSGEVFEASELSVIMDVSRKPMHTLVGLLFPMLILICLTWSVFWMNDQTISDRVNISFTGILSVVAYYLVIQDGIPEISYLTLVDVFIVISFLTLAASVLVSLKVDYYKDRNMMEMANQLDKTCRWAFPTVYFGLILIIYLVFAFIFG